VWWPDNKDRFDALLTDLVYLMLDPRLTRGEARAAQ